MPRFRPVFIASAFFTLTALVMWGLAIDWSADHECTTAMPLDRAGATAATVLAGVWWATLVLLRADRGRTVLIRTLAGAVQAQEPPAEAVPLRVVSSR